MVYFANMPEQILDQILRVKHSADLAERLDSVKRISNMSTREFASLIRELLEALCDDVERVGEIREPLIVISMQEVQDLRKAVVALRQENDTLKDVVRIFTDSRKH